MAHKFTKAEKAVVSLASAATHMTADQDWFADLPEDLRTKLYDACSAYHELFMIAYSEDDENG